MLKEAGASFGHHNILADPEMREGLKEYAQWPTFPQLWIDGKLVGGHDIVKDLAGSGELAKLVKEAVK
jgi:monothiol glutaredoxin